MRRDRIATNARKVRIPEELEREIGRVDQRLRVSWTDAAIELLDEGVRLQRVPGIVFVDGPVGRRAAFAGTGLDVWEVIGAWLAVGRDATRLRRAYEWLSEPQLDAALRYYELYPAEIGARLESEELWTEERTHAEYPCTLASVC